MRIGGGEIRLIPMQLRLRSGSVITKIRITRLANATDYLDQLKTELKDGYLGDMKAELYFSPPSKLIIIKE